MDEYLELLRLIHEADTEEQIEALMPRIQSLPPDDRRALGEQIAMRPPSALLET